MPDPQPILDAQGLQEALVRAGARLGPVRVLETVDSTNAEARRWRRAGAGEWALVVADHQTGGRGRRGRAWASPAGGNLYLSLLPPGLAYPGQACRVPLLAAVAVAEVLEAEGLAVGLKWPNDLLAPSRGKLGGILVEAEGSVPRSAIIGIGLNVNIPALDLAKGAASLREELGEDWDRLRLAARIVGGLQAWWEALARDRFPLVARAWMERAQWLGNRVRVTGATGSLVGEMRGIDDHGRLRLVTAEGERFLADGELSLRPEGDPR